MSFLSLLWLVAKVIIAVVLIIVALFTIGALIGPL
jgi:hypothetical protein